MKIPTAFIADKTINEKKTNYIRQQPIQLLLTYKLLSGEGLYINFDHL